MFNIRLSMSWKVMGYKGKKKNQHKKKHGRGSILWTNQRVPWIEYHHQSAKSEYSILGFPHFHILLLLRECVHKQECDEEQTEPRRSYQEQYIATNRKENQRSPDKSMTNQRMEKGKQKRREATKENRRNSTYRSFPFLDMCVETCAPISLMSSIRGRTRKMVCRISRNSSSVPSGSIAFNVRKRSTPLSCSKATVCTQKHKFYTQKAEIDIIYVRSKKIISTLLFSSSPLLSFRFHLLGA